MFLYQIERHQQIQQSSPQVQKAKKTFVPKDYSKPAEPIKTNRLVPKPVRTVRSTLDRSLAELKAETAAELEPEQTVDEFVSELVQLTFHAADDEASGVFALEDLTLTATPTTPVVEPPPVFDLNAFFIKYAGRTVGDKETFKTVGVAVPVELHARMTAFLKKNKDKENAPQSLKELTLLCLGQTLDMLEAEG